MNFAFCLYRGLAQECGALGELRIQLIIKVYAVSHNNDCRAIQRFLQQMGIEHHRQRFATALYTNESPELDMIVRTGGDLRLSNFLLWQAAYAELYFTDKLWPDMTEADVDAAIDDFKRRQRRFGGI